MKLHISFNWKHNLDLYCVSTMLVNFQSRYEGFTFKTGFYLSPTMKPKN